MLTAKLSTYSGEEVDKLLVEVSKTRSQICSNTVEPTEHTAQDCMTCPYSHICYDLSSLIDYLTREQTYGYPHCKK